MSESNEYKESQGSKQENAEQERPRFFAFGRGEKKGKKRRRNPFRGIQFSSVYARLVAIYITVIFITMMVLGFALGNYFSNQYREELTYNLLRECERINELVPTWLEGEAEARSAALAEMRLISRSNRAAIWVFYPNGEYISVVDPIIADWQEQESGANTPMMESVMESVMAGNQVRGYDIFSSAFSEPVMSIGTPWVVAGQVEGAVFMHARLSEIATEVNDVMQSIVLASCIAVALSVILVSWIAHRFTRPLVEMSRVMDSYAKGDFSIRVNEGGRDEIGRLSTSINEMATDLEGLEDLRRSFVANVSHELKSPLASMTGFVQAIQDGTIPPEDQREYLDIVLDESKRLNLLINDLLDLSKIESGDFPMNPSVFDINDLILHSMLTFEQRIDAKKMEVNLDFSQSRCMVYADKERIEQVLRNLIDNAVKYSGDGSLLAVRSQVEGRRVHIEVVDNGAGIAPNDLLHIWDRFYKVDKAHTRSDQGTGTGLGLSIVKRILDQHEASPTVRSVLGTGTTFSFYLPLASRHKRSGSER